MSEFESTYHAGLMDMPKRSEIENTVTDLNRAPGTRSNWRVILEPPQLRSVEEGRWNKLVKDEMRRLTENGAFDPKPRDRIQHLGMYLAEKTEAKWEEEAKANIDLLKDLITVIKSSGSPEEGRQRGMNVLNGRGITNANDELQKQMAELFGAMTARETQTREKLEEVYKKLIDEQNKQIERYDDIRNLSAKLEHYRTNKGREDRGEIAPGSAWELFWNPENKTGGDYDRYSVKQVTKDFIDNRIRPTKTAEMQGTVERNMRLMWMMLSREGGPCAIFPGHERDVEQARLDWIEADAELTTATTRDARSRAEAKKKKAEETIEKCTSAFTGTVKDRMEFGAVGISQIHVAAWKEARLSHEFVGSKLAVLPTASFEKASWEAMAIQADILRDYGIAQNSWSRLADIIYRATGGQVDINSLTVDPIAFEHMDPETKTTNSQSIHEAQLRQALDAHQPDTTLLTPEEAFIGNLLSPAKMETLVSFEIRLHGYLNQKDYAYDFNKTLSQSSDLQIIKNLTDWLIKEDSETGARTIKPRVIEDGKVQNKRDGSTSFEGPYAFVDIWSLVGSGETVSPTFFDDVLSNATKYPEIQALLAQNKIIIFHGFKPTFELGGGVSEGTSMEGSIAYNKAEAEQIKADPPPGWPRPDRPWSDRQLFAATLNDPRIQQRLGFWPARVASKEAVRRAKRLRTARKYLTSQGYTVINAQYIADPTPDFAGMVNHMMNGGKDLSAEPFMAQVPYANTLDRPNELEVVTTKPDLTRVVQYRHEQLQDSYDPVTGREGPKNEVRFLYSALTAHVDLAHRHAYVGTQSYTRMRLAGGKEGKQVMQLGAYVLAIARYVEKKKADLDAIYTGPDPDEVKIDRMIAFYDNTLAHIRFEIFTPDGKFIPNSVPREAAVDIADTRNWQGKLSSNLRSTMKNFVRAWVNKQPAAEVDTLRDRFEAVFDEWSEAVVHRYMLGLTASGMLERDNRTTAELQSAKRAELTMMTYLQIVEMFMRNIHGLNRGRRSRLGTATSQILGLISESGLVDYIRGASSGRAGRSLIQQIDSQLAQYEKVYKEHSTVMARIAAHSGHAVATAMPATPLGVIYHNTPSVLTPDAEEPYGVNLGETGMRAVKTIEEAIMKEGADNTDRIPKMGDKNGDADAWYQPFNQAGVHYNEFYTALLDATLRDTGRIVAGRFEENVGIRTEIRDVLHVMLEFFEEEIDNAGATHHLRQLVRDPLERDKFNYEEPYIR